MARGYTKYPLYSIEFNEFMYGSINADTCLRRDTKKIVIVSAQSDGIGYFYDFSNSAATTVSGYVALLAAAEALSHVRATNCIDLFLSLTSAQNQSAVVALPNDIIFTLFSTEQYGFAGSQRFVQDLTTPFKCLKNSTNGDTTASCAYSGAFCQNPCQVSGAFLNIGFDRISHILELSQVGGFTGANTTAAAAAEAVTHIYLHVDDATDSATLNLVDTLTGSIVIGNETEVASPMTVQFLPAFATAGTNDGNLRLPPSSAMSFLAKKKIPAVVLGDFRTNFTNPFYNSIYDDGGELTSVNIALMCSVATQTARSAFRLAGGSEADAAQFQADCDLIYELFICFTTNATCALFHSIYTGQTLPYVTSQPPTFTQQPFVTVPPFMMYNLLSNYTAAKRAENTCNSTDSSPNCSGAQSGAQCVSNACVWSQTNTHYAYGTGLEMDYTTSQFIVVDPTKATWVISGYLNLPVLIFLFLPAAVIYSASTPTPSRRFNSTNQRIRTFLTSSPLYQGIQVGVGVALTLVVTAATYYLQRHVDARFNKA
ncbi:hypothetical protein HDU82_002110 [Entophlyctis luteolus]|nr:hypothetical protein HDU82_002110 [Entophlyctis luteolus]